MVSGYVITNSNDTIYGLIGLRTPSINQEKCILVTSDNQKQTYLPGEIKGYRYSDVGKMYISKAVEIKEQEYLIFVEYLVQGGLSLFYFEHDKKPYYLFEEEDKAPLYITQDPPKVINLNVSVDLQYIGELNYHFRESSQVLKKLINNEKPKFNQKLMIEIAKQYNDENCLNPDKASCIVFESRIPDKFGVQVKFSVYTGIQSGVYYGKFSEGSSLSPLIGAQIYVYNPRWSNSFGIVLDLSFSKIDTGQSELKEKYVDYYKSMDYDMCNLSAKLGVRYTYSKHRLRPSIEGGLGFVSAFRNKSVLTRYGSGDELVDRVYDVRGSHFGWYIGAGLEYNIIKNHFVFVRFNYDGYLKSDGLQASTKDHIGLWHLKVGYTF